jgi:flagellar L-ring protein precursor FlgH
MRTSITLIAGLAAGAAILALPVPANAGLFGPNKQQKAEKAAAYAPAYAPSMSAPVADGAIFHAAYGYAPLISGMRAAQVGDVVTITLVEKTQAVKANSASTDRNGSISITPPPTGPLDFIKKTDIDISGGSTFAGKGNAAQSNALSGEISVTIAQVYPNGTMLVRGQKMLTLNRGDEMIQISGIIRPADISFDNRVLSTRVADARITYTGKGEIARASRQGWLNKFFSMLSPF